MKQISWLSFVIQLLLLVILILLARSLWPTNGIVIAAFFYLGYSIGARYVLTWHHRVGMRLVKRGRFQEALSEFLESLKSLERRPWIDSLRSVLLLSASSISYREMTLANIAFCYTQTGNAAKAREYYERCLEDYPDSGIAKAALRMMDTAAKGGQA